MGNVSIRCKLCLISSAILSISFFFFCVVVVVFNGEKKIHKSTTGNSIHKYHSKSANAKQVIYIHMNSSEYIKFNLFVIN